eukprot:TRINITY_DN356_c0_g1_i1.p1 TRINITY_DN356_c0_g1~~TRINITY_DN356_c0_g1_i1.p1  ORF type:complete len:146 (+),score=14.84 TRINITY_DN356_c0_g1_i1:175-612(+)
MVVTKIFYVDRDGGTYNALPILVDIAGVCYLFPSALLVTPDDGRPKGHKDIDIEAKRWRIVFKIVLDQLLKAVESKAAACQKVKYDEVVKGLPLAAQEHNSRAADSLAGTFSLSVLLVTGTYSLSGALSYMIHTSRRKNVRRNLY